LGISVDLKLDGPHAFANGRNNDIGGHWSRHVRPQHLSNSGVRLNREQRGTRKTLGHSHRELANVGAHVDHGCWIDAGLFQAHDDLERSQGEPLPSEYALQGAWQGD